MKLKSADIAFSRYVRQRDADDDGNCQCPLCPTFGPWKTFVNGHYIKRGYKTTRWHPDNGHAICDKCNSEMEYDTDLMARYALWVLAKIGSDRYSDLMILRLSDEKFTQVDIDDIAKKYRQFTSDLW